MDYNGNIWNKSHLGRFRHVHTYSSIIKHIPTYSGIIRYIQAYSDIFRTLCSQGILRTFVHLEPEAYSEPCQGSLMKHLGKIVKRLPPLQNYSLSESSRWYVINEFIYLKKKIMFRSLDIKIFVFLWNLQILKSVMSSQALLEN